MSYFNEEQQAYMRYLGTIPRRERCASGWHLKDKCPRGEAPCTAYSWTVCPDCKGTGHFLDCPPATTPPS